MNVIDFVNNIYKKQYTELPITHQIKQDIINRGLDVNNDCYGYAGSNFEVKKACIRAGFKDKDLQEAGLLNKSNNILFYNRLMFDIKSVDGDTIAFTGRDYNNPDKYGKYMNSMSSNYYDKGDGFYNMDKVDFNNKNFFVVEGLFDVIAMNEKGYDNVLASCGTGITQSQINQLYLLADDITFVLDGDEAGVNAVKKVYENFPEIRYKSNVVILPDGKDPCDYLKDNDKLPDKVKMKECFKEDKSIKNNILSKIKEERSERYESR